MPSIQVRQEVVVRNKATPNFDKNFILQNEPDNLFGA